VKHVEQFPDKINFVMLHLVGYILEYNWYCSVCDSKANTKIIRGAHNTHSYLGVFSK
jgi:hypothetical protein